MRKSKYTETQFPCMNKEAKPGIPEPEVCRNHDISQKYLLQIVLKVWGV